MSIIVKGIDKPKNCAACPFGRLTFGNEVFCVATRNKYGNPNYRNGSLYEVPKFCPIEEVTE